MNNTKLLRFIDKYHLGGEIKSVKWVSNGNKLSTRFISGDKSVVGSVVLDKFDNTSQLISLLTILGDDIKFNLSSAGEKFISIDMVDTTRNTKSKYMLSDLSVIPTPPPMKNLPDKFELKLDVTRYFINTFINGKSALPDSDSFTILCKGGKVNVVIGYSSIASNRVTIPIETSEYEDIEPISFNAKMFANILSSNKECESATLEVSSAGLSRIKFKVDDYSSEYYLVATQQVT